MNSSDVEIENTLTRKQYMILSLLFTLRMNVSFIYLTMFIGFLVRFGILTEEKTIRPAIEFLIVMIVVLALITLFMGLSKKNKNFFLPSVYTINEECVIEKTSISENIYKWDVFVKWENIGGFYLLYLSHFLFLPVNANNIKEDDISAFNHLLETHIGAPTTRIWSWKMRGALYFAILTLLSWLFIIFCLFMSHELADRTEFIIVIAGSVIILLLFVAEFYFIIRGKKSGNRLMTNISYGIFLFTIVIVLLLVILSIVPL